MFAKIKSFFARDRINIGRQRNLDILKAVSIFGMVVCHIAMALCLTDSGVWIADRILGSYMGVAHAFMICMGIGMTFSRKNKISDYVKRGISLLILAYALNLLRGGLLIAIFKSDQPNYVAYNVLMDDILQFAGLANLAVAGLKALKLKNIHILAIGAVLSLIAGVVPSVNTGNIYINSFLGTLIQTVDTSVYGTALVISSFSFINWFVFVGIGLVFGDIIQRVKDLDTFYKEVGIITAVIAVAYLTSISITRQAGIYSLNVNGIESTVAAFHSGFGPAELAEYAEEAGYYAPSIIDVIGLTSIDLALASAFHFLTKKVKFPFLTMTANNLTIIYIIHWTIGGTLMFLCARFGWINSIAESLGTVAADLIVYAIAIAIYFGSSFLSIPVKKLQKNLTTAYREKH